ncbi:hypothetical protein Bbelb_020190 [Branchiostoma belcheri]|nr:hypothetical protein Bbelb_020190 [Branchiostoma belcheri]
MSVRSVKPGSLVFFLQCADLAGLGQLWFMYKSGELDNLLHDSLISEETLQQLSAESITVKATIKVQDFRKVLVYLLTTPLVKGQSIARLPLECPLYQPHSRTISNVLEVLHLDDKNLPRPSGKQHSQESVQLEGSSDVPVASLDILQTATDLKMECPDCGESVLRAMQKFCHKCGTQLQKRQKFQDSGDGGVVVVPTSSTASAVLAAKPANEPNSSKERPLDLAVGEGSVSSLSADHRQEPTDKAKKEQENHFDYMCMAGLMEKGVPSDWRKKQSSPISGWKKQSGGPILLASSLIKSLYGCQLPNIQPAPAKAASYYRPPPNKTSHKPEVTERGSTMTLHFHVLVSPDFKMKPKVDQVHVRSDIVDWNDWESLAVLEITRHLKDDYLVAEGKCTVNLGRISNRYISFKYVVVHQDSKMSWEFIHYNMGGVMVNRCFKLSAEECQPGAEVHLYNDVMQVEHGLKDKFKSIIGWSSVEKKVIHDRQIAAHTWLPRWKGFTCDQQGEEQLACDVMKQVEDICKWLTLSPISAGANRRVWALQDFSFAEVLMEYIRPKLDQLEKTKEHKKESPEEAQARIVSALSLCWLVNRFNLQLTEKQVHTLFDGLLIRPDVKDKSCHEVETFFLHFLDGRLKEVTDAVVNLINAAMSGNALTSRWLLALPVLHFLRNESTPFKPVAPTTDFQKASQKWWGLEGLKYKQFKKDIKYRSAEKPLAVMKEPPALFEADRLLERSCAAILTNKELLDPLTVKTASLPTLCAAIAVNVATGYSLSVEEDRQMCDALTDTQEVAVLALLETATALAASKGDDATRKEACQTFCIANEVLLSCLDACTYLERHPILIGAVHLAAACMSNLWLLMDSATDAKAQNMQTSMKKLIENVTTPNVMKWLDKKLNVRISPYAAGEESKVWLGVLSVDWGKEEVNNYWNKRLLGNLHQRLLAISPMERVELFCSLDTSTFPQHLAQCYSDAAFEAVDDIVKVLFFVPS